MHLAEFGAGARTGSPGDAVRSGLRVLAIGAWIALVAATVPPLLRPAGHTTASWVGAGLVVAHQVLVLACLVLWPRSRRAFTAAGVLFVGGFALLVAHRRWIDPINQWTPGYLGLPWAIWATLALPGRRYLPVVLGTFGAMTTVDALYVLVTTRPLTGRDLLASLWIFFPPVMVMLFGDALRRVAVRLESQIRRREAAERESVDRRAEVEARSEAARLLHDHVLHALHAVARVGGGLTDQMARQECRDALTALDREVRDEALADVRALVEEDPLVAATGAVVDGDVGEVPLDVAHALAAAVHEALGNVQRHAAANAVTVRLEQRASHRRITVEDDGAGFAPDRVPESRLGVRRSIRGRLEDVGGLATIDSRPGAGTRVVLSWPRPDAERLDPTWTTGTHRMMRRMLVRTSWPGLMATALSIPLMAPAVGGWGTALVASLQVLVGLHYARVLRHRPVRAADVAVVLAVSVLGWYAVLALGPADGTLRDIYDLWPAWACPALLHLVVLQLPVGVGIRIVVGWSVLMVAGLVVRHPHLDWARDNPLVTTSIGEGFLTLAALAIFRSLSARHVAEREMTDRSRLAVARLRHEWQVRDFWSRRVTGEALPLVEAVADGRTSASDPEVQQHARLVEATLRDELILGPEQVPMLLALAELRGDGWQVGTPSVTPGHEPFLSAIAHWTAKVGPPAFAGQPVKITVSGRLATLVVLDPSPAQLQLWRRTARRLGADLDEGPGFARLRATLPERPSGRW